MPKGVPKTSPCPTCGKPMANEGYEPNEEHRAQARAMSGYGIPQAKIAQFIGISHRQLLKWYPKELDLGMIEANAAVAQALYQKAISSHAGSVVAAIFWLKTRARWSVVDVLKVEGSLGGGGVQLANLNLLPREDLDALEQIAGRLEERSKQQAEAN